jgi:CHAD domain-containing protein
MSRAWSVPDLDPKASLATNARRILAVRVAELFSYSPMIPNADAVAELHAARISAKRLRYTLELFRVVFGADGEAAIAEMKKLQDDLGLIHDHDVRIDLIKRELSALPEESAEGAADPRPGLAALLEREQAARARKHAAVVKRWHTLEHGDFRSKLADLSTAPS